MSFPSLLDLFLTALAVVPSLCIHEYAHGYVSYLLGDPTPKTDGRLSLNPLHHLDPIGTLFLIIFKFGWAKPVMVNPSYYEKPKQGMGLVALAGPVSNFIMALLCLLATTVIAKTSGGHVSEGMYYMYQFLSITAVVNTGLGVFNLIPLPPLDGSKVLGMLLPDELYFKYMRFEQYGFILLFALLMLGSLNTPLYLMRAGVLDYLQFVADKLTLFLS